eukprot:123719_1
MIEKMMRTRVSRENHIRSMLSSSFLVEQDPEEYIPLLLNRYDFDNESNHDSDTSIVMEHVDDPTDDDVSMVSMHKNDDWLFTLINWDQIFVDAASHLHIKFTDYDYDRYDTNGKDKLKHALKNTTSTVDTFNYFLSTLSNGRINMSNINGTSSTNPISNAYSVSIYEIIYDRVAKSRLYSLQCLLDELYPDLNASTTRIVAEIVKFELAPDTIRHLLYKSIINQYTKQCHPSLYKSFILISNWLIYILFFVIHIMWLQFVWMDFLKHFNWDDDDDDDGQDASQEPIVDSADGDTNANAHVLAASISFRDATPLTIFATIARWTYFQWTCSILFMFLMVYMVILYCIARRVDAFGDFLKKLQLTQLLQLGKADREHTSSYGTRHHTHIMQQYGATNEEDSDHTEGTSLSDDGSIFSESDINEDAVWNYNESLSPPQLHMHHGIDILSSKLVNDIENIYFQREHLILYTVISLVKMLIILLYLSCLVIFFLIPSANYWYLWSIMFDIFAFYVILKAAKQICCRYTAQPASIQPSQNVRYVTDNGDIGIVDCDGIFKHEWIVAMVNVVSVSGLLIITTLIISEYMNDYNAFVAQRLIYLQILAAVEIVWFASQFLLWKLNFYGTIFYLLLLIPSILFGSAAFYALYEYYILSLVHTFLAVIFSCGEFHLVGPHDDDTTLDPSDWSVLGVLALLAKLFKFRMPQQI